MDREGLIAICFMSFLGITMGWMVITCFIEPVYKFIKQKILEKRVGREMTLDEVNAFIKQMDEQERGKTFWNIVQDYIEGNPEPGPYMADNEFVEVLQPCGHHDCALHASREDCCHDVIIKNGVEYCRTYININKLCGIESHTDKSALMTDEERELFYEYFDKFMKYLHEEESKKQQ